MTFMDVIESSLDVLQAHQNGLLSPLDQEELDKEYDDTRRF